MTINRAVFIPALLGFLRNYNVKIDRVRCGYGEQIFPGKISLLAFDTPEGLTCEVSFQLAEDAFEAQEIIDEMIASETKNSP